MSDIQKNELFEDVENAENANVESVDDTSEQTALQNVQDKKDDIILEVDDLQKHFVLSRTLFGKPTSTLKAVDHVSFKLKRGTTIGIVGESGCGKTTMGRTILKLYDIDGGKVYYNGEDITNISKKKMRSLRTSMQLIFQDPYSSLPPRMTIGNIISEAVKVHKIVPKEEVSSYVRDIMKKCGLQEQYYDRYPHEFSGGQRQRICIARALAVKPDLVICDEPVSALDVSVQAQIINLLKELQQTMNLTYVFISHDLSVVKYITDEIMVMYLGNMMEKGDTDELFDNPLHPYTKALFSAVPVPDPDVKSKRIILEGDIPSPANPPKGCKFHTRCSQCMNACKIIEPKYHEVTPGHFVACHLYDEDIMSRQEELDRAYEHVKEMEERQKEIADEYDVIKKIREAFEKILKKKKTDASEESIPVENDEIEEEIGGVNDFKGADIIQNQEVTHTLEDGNAQDASDVNDEEER